MHRRFLGDEPDNCFPGVAQIAVRFKWCVIGIGACSRKGVITCHPPIGRAKTRRRGETRHRWNRPDAMILT